MVKETKMRRGPTRKSMELMRFNKNLALLCSSDRYLLLLLQQFHLEQIQSLTEALMTLTAGECVTHRERERENEDDSESRKKIDRRAATGK